MTIKAGYDWVRNAGAKLFSTTENGYSVMAGGTAAVLSNIEKYAASLDAAARRATLSHDCFAVQAQNIQDLVALTAILRSLPLNLLITKPNSNIIWICSRQLAEKFGAPVASVENQPLTNIPYLDSECMPAVWAALSTEEHEVVSCTITSATGIKSAIDFLALRITTSFGNIGVAIGTDIIKADTPYATSMNTINGFTDATIAGASQDSSAA